MKGNKILISLFYLAAAGVLSACTNNTGEASIEHSDNEKTVRGEMDMERHDESSMGGSMDGHYSLIFL